jgi:hypothetical protein
MIHYIQRNWISRFDRKDVLWEMAKRLEVPQIDLSGLGDCDKNDIILEGIDYHCYPWMINKLLLAHPTLTEKQIKGAIWFCRSRTNFRVICHESLPLKTIPELENVYQKIKEDVDKLCNWIHTKIVV